MTGPTYTSGLDLGQASDFSAIVVVEAGPAGADGSAPAPMADRHPLPGRCRGRGRPVRAASAPGVDAGHRPDRGRAGRLRPVHPGQGGRDGQDVLLTAIKTTWGYDPAKGKLSTWLSRLVRTVQDRHHRFNHRQCRDRRKTRPLPENPRFRCREMEPLERLMEEEETAAA